MEKHRALNPRQQCIIPIAALTAEGDINRLKPALNQGLDAGLKAEEEGSKIVGQSEDCKEGFSAFLEKRKPDWA